MIICGDRVSLRDFGLDDVEAVAAYACDPVVTSHHLVWGPHAGRQETASWLRETIAQASCASRQHFELAVVDNLSGGLVGEARVTVRNPVHRIGDIGYVLRQSQWGQGYGTEVARLLVRMGFWVPGLHRVEATCDPANVASRRVLEKVGMRPEGCMRENFWIRGSWRDSLLFAILEHEWQP